MDPSYLDHLEPFQKEQFSQLAGLLGGYFEGSKTGEGSRALNLSSADYDAEAFRTFQRAMLSGASVVKVPRAQVLQRSVLITLVSGFESLLTDLAQFAIRLNPRLVNLDEVKISLLDLKTLGSITEATERLISEQVDALSRGTIDDQIKWFDRLGIETKSIASDWLAFREPFARRNLLVHTSSKVNGTYVKSLRAAGAESKMLPTIGEALRTDEDYLEKACNHLLAAGVCLVQRVWAKLFTQDAQGATAWTLRTIDHALEEGFDVACLLLADTVFGAKKPPLALVDSLRLKISTWTARVRLGFGAEVANEAGAWDVRGIDRRYSHTRLLFTGQYEAAMADIKILIATRRLAKIDVLLDPVYQGLRESLGERLKSELAGVNIAGEEPVA